MSSVKKQEIFKDINPLIKIYAQEENKHYIPASKRRKISQFMGRANLYIGSGRKSWNL